MLNALLASLPTITVLAEEVPVGGGFDITGAVTTMISSVDFTIFATVFIAIMAAALAPEVTMTAIRKAKGWLLGAIKRM